MCAYPCYYNAEMRIFNSIGYCKEFKIKSSQLKKETHKQMQTLLKTPRKLHEIKQITAVSDMNKLKTNRERNNHRTENE